MIRNYLIIAFRNLKSDLTYSITNILGLGIGVAAFLLIGLYINDELNFDRFHKKSDRIFLLYNNFMNGPQGEVRYANTYISWGESLKNEISGIKEVVSITRYSSNVLVKADKNQYYEKDIFYTQSSFFQVFDFHLLYGDPTKVFHTPLTVVLTESMAKKYFDDSNPVGKSIVINNSKEYLVSGVVKDPPSNSHLKFNMLVSIKDLYNTHSSERLKSQTAANYFLLDQHINPKSVQAQLNSIVKNPDHLSRDYHLDMIALEDIYLYGGFDWVLQQQGDIWYIYLFGAVALLILLMACINYMNLSTARYVKRAKEVGIRKSVGANRRQLINQFMMESLIFCFISVIIGFAIMELVQPLFEAYLERSLLGFNSIGAMIGGLLITTLLVGVMAGSYPAFFLSRFNPSHIFRMDIGKGSGKITRKMMLFFQFLISQALIITALFIFSQLEYTRNKHLGFNKEHMLILPFYNDINDKADVLKNNLLQLGEVRDVSCTNAVPGKYFSIRFYPPDEIENFTGEETMVFDYFISDIDFIKTFEINIISGRGFLPNHATDSNNAIIINEEAVKKLGWDNPIGKYIGEPEYRKRVIGVFSNFHNASFKDEIRPLIIEYSANNLHPNYVAIKLSSTNLPKAIAEINSIWTDKINARPMDYFFLDDYFDGLYRKEQKLGIIFNWFAVLAIIIAILGLVGLTAYTTERRSKEFSIRKILGAKIGDLIKILSIDFIKLILISALFSIFVAWYFVKKWLENFAYKVDINLWIAIAVVISAITLTMVIVLLLSSKAMRSNPSSVLRKE